MSHLRKKITNILPESFLWRLTILHFLVIVVAMIISGWALYHTACFLAAGVGNLNEQRQEQFNQTLLNYVWLFIIISIIAGTIVYFYLTRRLLKPVRSLMHATELLKRGEYPEAITVSRKDEIGQLVEQYNELIEKLTKNEVERKKLVSDISHEFRTPLSNLNGYLLALKSGDITGDEQLFAALYQESKRLTSMLEQFDQLKKWDYTTSQTPYHKEKTAIHTLIQQCIAMFNWTLKQEKIAIDVQLEESSLSLHPEGIQQVVSNLLDNAIRYYQGTGAIHISGKVQQYQYIISITGPSENIPQMEQEKLFERFYRLDSSRSRETGGAGLGLAITKEIIDQHDGSITIRSSDNQNTFNVYLPIK
ncbi:cell wall metabolism sensor histidine kinase WalK [Virgibacillus sp. Bac332]|uniref:sensor histidine kinase n=1 Tax=Virgibacillus sp. Bac332 TaxID=2419842 RepID=UPI001F09553E|nr:ATP-binding protein [Virgibacillus sp. Bac332]